MDAGSAPENATNLRSELMSEIRFYHLQRASLEDTLPVILERACGRGDRILVMTGSSERAD